MIPHQLVSGPGPNCTRNSGTGTVIMTNKRRFRGFVGYQFKSKYFNRTELDHAVIEAFERAEADLSKDLGQPVQLTVTPFDIASGTHLYAEILKLIDEADFCVFELSDLNNNVFLELGFALGRSKPCIFLLHEE